MVNFKTRFLNLINIIESSNMIEVINIEKDYRDLSDEQLSRLLNRFKDRYNLDFNEFFIQYLFPSDRLSVKWIGNNEYQDLEGSFCLNNFYMSLVNPLDTSFKDKVSLDDAKLLKEGYRFFDRPNEIDRAAIKITAGKIEDKVYFINELNKPQRMTLSYPEYMDKVIEIKGLRHWQYLFIEGLKFKDVQFGLERELGDRLKMYKEVFPDEDISEYQKLFEEMK